MTQAKEARTTIYEYEIGRFLELMKENREYAFSRYGLTLLYSLPPEETFALKSEMGWKGKDPLDYYNMGTMECLQGKWKEGMKLFEKAEAAGCGQPELFFNIGVIFEDQKDIPQAKAYYQKYIDAVEKYDDIPKKLQLELDEVRDHLKTL
ncbi:MAG: tetratricopeptide repeat protein [Candidatus Omnitrophota bacterium]